MLHIKKPIQPAILLYFFLGEILIVQMNIPLNQHFSWLNPVKSPKSPGFFGVKSLGEVPGSPKANDIALKVFGVDVLKSQLSLDHINLDHMNPL